MNRHNISGLVVDSMCGGGTTLAECRLRGLDAIGIDVNPVSRAVSELVASPLPVKALEDTVESFLDELALRVSQGHGLFQNSPKRRAKPLSLRYCSEYFLQDAQQDIAEYLDLLHEIPDELKNAFYVALFAVMRHISRANIKKMNLEIDDNKKTIHSLYDAVSTQLRDIVDRNRNFSSWALPGNISVIEGEAAATGLEDSSVSAVFLHPPYLSNTAFCEFSQLQLAILDIDHKSVWKKELRCRGSFLHEPNGLRKYLVGWAKIIQEAYRILKPGGTLVSVVGDGQIDYVRIPVGSITLDFAQDAGFEHLESFLHVLNNNTGQTQNRKMKGQHVAIFKRR
jgi:DNA modification methylase